MADTSIQNLVDIAKMYEFAQRMYSEIPYRFFKGGYSFPAWHYYLEVTRRCNLRCKMCQYIDWLENTPIREQMKDELSTEEWLHVIDQIPRFSLITFTGGETFVRKDFMEILTYASKKARTHFISNTTMLPEERAEAVVKLSPKRLGGIGFNFAGTSIEGPGDRHDEIRQMRGAWNRSMSGIEMLRKYRDATGKQCPLIHVTTVLQKDNMDVLHLMPKMMKDVGVDVLNLVTETRMHDLPNFGDVDPASFSDSDVSFPHIPRAVLNEALERTVEEAKRWGVELRLPRMPRTELLKYYDGGIDLKDYECRNAWNTLFVGRQGNAYPCWIQKVGNVREQSLKEIWNGPVIRDFRQVCQKKLFAMCPGCCFIDHKTQRSGVETVNLPQSTPAAATIGN